MSEANEYPTIFQTIRRSKWVALPVLIFIILGCLMTLMVLAGLGREFSLRDNAMVVRPARSQTIAFSCFTLTAITWFYAAYAILQGRPAQGYSVAAAACIITSLFYFVA